MSSTTVNPYAAPMPIEDGDEAAEALDSTNLAGYWRDGGSLVVSKNAILPDICVVTNRHTCGTGVNYPFVWTPPGIRVLGWMLVVVMLPVGLLYAWRVRHQVNQRALIRIPVGADLAKRWQDAKRTRECYWNVCRILIVFSVVSIVFANCFASVNAFTTALGFFLFAIVSAVIGQVRAQAVGWSLAVKQMNQNYVWLAGVHPDYLISLPTLPAKP